MSRKKKLPQIGDVIVAEVDPVFVNVFKSLEAWASFVRREMEIIEQERKLWWARIEKEYNLDHDSFVHVFNFERGDVRILSPRGKDEPKDRYIDDGKGEG
jgi:hypothetical protein